MKFTKQQAFEKLKSILTEDGKKTLRMSEKSINETLENLMPLIASDETELDAFVEKVKPTFITMNGNAEHDMSAFVNKWKQEHPEPQQQQQQQQQQGNETAEMKAMRERLEALEQKETARQTTKTIEDKKKQILAKLKEKGIKNEDWCNGMIAEVDINTDTDVDAKVESLVAFYNKHKAASGGGYTPRGGAGGGEGNKSEFDDIKAAREKEIGTQQQQQ